MLISEYEQINKELVDEIDIYSVQDEEAFSILNRKQVMKDVRVANNRKIAQTGELIRGIRYWQRPDNFVYDQYPF